MGRWTTRQSRPSGLLLLALIAAAVLACGCWGQRYRLRTETWEHAASQRVVQDSTAVNIRGVRRMLSLSSGRQAVLILPEGRFQFRPDSGFSGQASLVLIAAKTAKVGMESDSVAGSLDRRRKCRCRQLFFLLALSAPLANILFIISLLQSLLG